MTATYSPALALLTGVFEVIIAARAVSHPGRREIVRPAVILLLLLAGYQFAEILVCSNPSRLAYARFAFADVVWLPPLGLKLVSALSAPGNRKIRMISHAGLVAAGGLAAWVLLDPAFIRHSLCQVVIARYEHGTPLYPVYGGFYLLGLGAMMVGAGVAMADQEDRLLRLHLADVQLGTILFVVPALLLQTLKPELAGTSPSMMCHFAAAFAIGLWHLLSRERHWAEANTAKADPQLFRDPLPG